MNDIVIADSLTGRLEYIEGDQVHKGHVVHDHKEPGRLGGAEMGRGRR